FDFILVSQKDMLNFQKLGAGPDVFRFSAGNDPDLNPRLHQDLQTVPVFDIELARPALALQPKNASVGHHSVHIQEEKFDLLQTGLDFWGVEKLSGERCARQFSHFPILRAFINLFKRFGARYDGQMNPMTLIAGPCVIEDDSTDTGLVFEVAEELKRQ